MRKSTCTLMCISCFLFGIIIGFYASPIKKGLQVHIGSDNINTPELFHEE